MKGNTMSLLTWIGSLRFASRRRRRPRENQSVYGRSARRLLVAERLEDRCLLAYDIFDLGNIGAVAVNSSQQVAANIGGHAALWQSGTLTDLGTLGGPSSRAN